VPQFPAIIRVVPVTVQPVKFCHARLALHCPGSLGIGLLPLFYSTGFVLIPGLTIMTGWRPGCALASKRRPRDLTAVVEILELEEKRRALRHQQNMEEIVK
jgi:hypothetical protein